MPRADKADLVEQMLSQARVERASGGQMVDIYGVPCDVHSVRTFRDGRQLGAGYELRDPSPWFVYDCEAGATGNGIWHKHCGPYSSFDEARDWILAIRESSLRPCQQCGGSGSLPDMTCCLVCGGGGKVPHR